MNEENASFNVFDYAVSLRLRHPSRDPESFTAVLGLLPKISDKAGERRNRPGRELGFVSRESYWVHELSPAPGQRFEDFLTSWLKRLSAHEAVFHQLSAEGGKAELFVGFFMESQSCGIELTPSLMGDCAALGLELGICLYGPNMPIAPLG